MANDEHLALLKKGVAAWNAWREANKDKWSEVSVPRVQADLTGADLRGADLTGADLEGARLDQADLSGANLKRANLSWAKAHEAKFICANLFEADLRLALLISAKLWGTNLQGADLGGTHLDAADLRGADLTGALLLGTDLRFANLSDCCVYGVSAWGVNLEGTTQESLLITPKTIKPEITVDNIEVAQFVYLLLHNEKIRDVIDTVGKKAVLLLGRFTPERKKVLDTLREELRKRDYLPILFDFEVPATRDITETVSLLARMSRFIIADLTDPSSIPKELEAIVPTLAVPVQPVLEGSVPYAMFKDYWKYDWVLGLEPLLATLAEKVIAPAEGKVKALQERRRMIEAELTKPR